MSFFGSMIDGIMLSKAKAAIRASEGARRESVRKAMAGILGRVPSDQEVDSLLAASRQSDAVRGVASVAGKNVIGELLAKLADALEEK